MIKLKSINGLIALAFIGLSWTVLFWIVFKQLGGDNALFAILGYIGGWLNSIVLFFFRKPPSKEDK